MENILLYGHQNPSSLVSGRPSRIRYLSCSELSLPFASRRTSAPTGRTGVNQKVREGECVTRKGGRQGLKNKNQNLWSSCDLLQARQVLLVGDGGSLQCTGLRAAEICRICSEEQTSQKEQSPNPLVSRSGRQSVHPPL